jgi:hypothetical protein
MSTPHRDLRLRMEMLRLRGELQRADAEAALRDVRDGSRGMLDLVATVFRVGSASRSGAQWVGPLIAGLRERPWLAGLAMFALRSVRRHPVAALVAAAAAALAARFVFRSAAPRDPSGSLARNPDPLAD